MKAKRSNGDAEEALHTLSEDAVQILVENHRNFRAFLAKRVGSESMAEDLLQQSLKKAVEFPPRETEDLSILAWFYRVLRTTLVDYYRAHASDERKTRELENLLVALGDDRAKPHDELKEAICGCMEELLPLLKSSYAEVIQRVDLRGEPIEQVARDVGVTTNNLTVRLHRARQALKLSLERSCGTCTQHGCLNCTCG